MGDIGYQLYFKSIILKSENEFLKKSLWDRIYHFWNCVHAELCRSVYLYSQSNRFFLLFYNYGFLLPKIKIVVSKYILKLWRNFWSIVFPFRLLSVFILFVLKRKDWGEITLIFPEKIIWESFYNSDKIS